MFILRLILREALVESDDLSSFGNSALIMDAFLNKAQNQEEASVLTQCWTLYFDTCMPMGNAATKEYVCVP